jgi:hypothetical protein
MHNISFSRLLITTNLNGKNGKKVNLFGYVGASTFPAVLLFQDPRFQTPWGPHKLRSKRRISKSNSQLLLLWLLFRKRCTLYQEIN